MSYLIPSDYKKQIQDQNLQAIITSTPSIQAAAELAAQEESISYLVQKYDVSKEFTNTLVYDPAKIYNAADRVYLDAPVYAQQAYILGALVLQAGKVYICTTAIGAGEVFNAAHWTALGNQYDIFFAKYPFNLFDLNILYRVGDQVYWNGRKYTCRIATQPYSENQILQYGNTINVPSNNIFPDDAIQGPAYWTNNGVYTVPAGSLSNAVYFTKGDNRSQQLVMYMIDITLFHLHSRISPRNVPEIRAHRYEAATSWLKMASKGTITASLVRIQPRTGNRIRSGSNIKQNNSY